jgi:hypothetical protein
MRYRSCQHNTYQGENNYWLASKPARADREGVSARGGRKTLCGNINPFVWLLLGANILIATCPRKVHLPHAAHFLLAP